MWAPCSGGGFASLFCRSHSAHVLRGVHLLSAFVTRRLMIMTHRVYMNSCIHSMKSLIPTNKRTKSKQTSKPASKPASKQSRKHRKHRKYRKQARTQASEQAQKTQKGSKDSKQESKHASRHRKHSELSIDAFIFLNLNYNSRKSLRANFALMHGNFIGDELIHQSNNVSIGNGIGSSCCTALDSYMSFVGGQTELVFGYVLGG